MSYLIPHFTRVLMLALALILPIKAMAQSDLAIFAPEEGDSLTVPLQGEWGFAWGELLSPMEAHKAYTEGTLERAPVPSRWQDFIPKDPENPYYHGVATYVAPVDVPLTNEHLVLAMSTISEAYRVYWVPLVGPHYWHMVAEAGHMEGEPQAAIRNQVHDFQGRGKGLLVLQVRKDVFGWSGINSWNGILNKPEITTREANLAERTHHELILGIVVGIIMFTMAQNFFLYGLNPKDAAPFYLAFGCLLIAMRALILWDKIELWFGPEWFVIRMRLEMMNIVFATTMLVGLNRALLPDYYPAWLMRAVLTVVALLCGFILTAPPDMMSNSLPVYQAHALFVCVASLWGIVRAILAREQGAVFASVALGTLIFGASHDVVSVILTDYEVLLIEHAFTATMVFYTFLIGQRFAQSQRRATTLMEERATLQRMHRAAVNSARHDHLTGLLNRQAFDHEFALAWEGMAKSGEPMAMVLFDIDHFKAFNDTHGHQVGDIVLKSLGESLRNANMRRADSVCRYGGEEFAVILPNTNEEEAACIADRLRKEISAMRVSTDDGTILRITCSFGVAEARNRTTTVNALLRNADDSLYDAKRAGRNRVRTYSGLVSQPAVA
ncbi:diguanylate cyclase (GGDEF)-like protein [Shimia isoporae]|uniref:diguanylate cyclase n=1 Tax=Shimia isoporae TaxID=647720 RepID=A0A4R1NTB1_9RHOB|nr:diguanylate cyclase [Shimia isoporae]TCL10043.1 diguanylate cyclase (GGDEF)-like protein [Shimia isoporae]